MINTNLSNATTKYTTATKSITITAGTNSYLSFTAADLDMPIGSKAQFAISVLDNAWSATYISDTFSRKEITAETDVVVNITINNQRNSALTIGVECRVAYL